MALPPKHHRRRPPPRSRMSSLADDGEADPDINMPPALNDSSESVVNRREDEEVVITLETEVAGPERVNAFSALAKFPMSQATSRTPAILDPTLNFPESHQDNLHHQL